MAKPIKGKQRPEKPYVLEGKMQKVFGVYLPPRKRFKAKKYITIRFVFTGLVPSKKNDYYSENNIRIIIRTAIKKFGFTAAAFKYITDNAKSWIRGSRDYLKWLDDIDSQVREQAEFWRTKYNLEYPLDFVSIKNYYYYANAQARDLISKDESIYDMLVTKNFIHDDDYSVLHKITSEGANYHGEITDHIVEIFMTISVF